MTSFKVGADVSCDLDRLIDTRLLVQANSGGGKSWLVRRLLEQTHGKVQHLVIDPEGEFPSLRERFDYVLAARNGGDTAADPRSARLLAERLLELGVSAILDIYELKAHHRIEFVRAFLEALVDAPKKLWHPALVVVDEAHVFCPQVGDAESADAVKDLATRGRKRGFCAVLATQRLAKLHKDAAAELNNKLIGRTGMDVDMKRAGDELGFSKEDARQLRDLDAGEFFAFGPAISRSVVKVRVGPVVTSHPKAGARIAVAAPPPTAKVIALLPKLADLPAEAEERIRTVEDLRRETADLRRQLTAAEKARPEVEVERVEVPAISERDLQILDNAAGVLRAAVSDLQEVVAVANRMSGVLDGAVRLARSPAPRRETNRLPRETGTVVREPSRPRHETKAVSRETAGDGLVGAEQRILDALAELEVLGVESPDRVQVAFLAGYTNLRSKGFANASGSLSSAGLVEYPTAGAIALTDDGRRRARFPAAPRSPEEIQDRVLRLLGGAHERILRPLLEAYPESIERHELAAAAGYLNLRSKGFANAMGRLRSLGFIDYPDRGTVAAAPVLFLEARA